MELVTRGKIDLIVVFKSVAIGSIALGSLLLFSTFISLATILLALLLEMIIELKLIYPGSKRGVINMLFPITSIVLIVLALASSSTERAIALLALSFIIAGFRAWGYVGHKLKGLFIGGSSIVVTGCLGLLFLVRSSSPGGLTTLSSNLDKIIYELIMAAPWSTLILAGLIIFSSTLIYMLKYIPPETSLNASEDY